MITMVEVHTSRGQVMTLPLGDPSYGILMHEIEGLDPVKATLVSSSFAQQDGEQYHSSKREARNIILKMELKPSVVGETVRGLRNTLYGIFMPKSEVRMSFHSEGYDTVDIFGRIESFDCPIFTEEPTATISLMCYDPDFFDPTPVIFEGVTTDTETEYSFEYEGSIETGVIFELSVNRTHLTGVTFNHRDGADVLSSMSIAVPLVNENVMRINTNPGEKEATVSGNSMLYGVSPYAQWITLEPGMNHISVFAEGAPMPFTLTYTNKYGGL